MDIGNGSAPGSHSATQNELVTSAVIPAFVAQAGCFLVFCWKNVAVEADPMGIS